MTFAAARAPYPKADILAPFLARTDLAEADRRALGAAVGEIHSVAPGHCIREQGATPQSLVILVEGIAHAVRILNDGRQQILALYVPGDAMDCQPARAPLPFRLCAVTTVRIARIACDDLAALMRASPGIAHALWCETARQMALQQEWLVSLGRQSSHARLAHFICEVSARFGGAGLGDGQRCPLPLTQIDISDALGISAVHVNRVLQQLRKEGLLTVSRGFLHIVDRDALYKIANFDPAYLGITTTLI
jgi:CRP-like cAMP-binding protein